MRKIAFITDLHLGESFPKEIGVNANENFDRVIEDVKRREIDTIILGGDIGDRNTLESLYQKISGYNVLTILGNHDSFEDVKDYFDSSINWGVGELYYTFEDSDNRYIFMDSSKEYISTAQLNWLAGQLSSQKNIRIFIHHPVLSIDTPIDKQYPLINRDAVFSMLAELPNHVTIFCGHYHMQSLQVENNISQYITPAVSFQVLKDATVIETTNKCFGYRVISVDGINLKTTEIILTVE